MQPKCVISKLPNYVTITAWTVSLTTANHYLKVVAFIIQSNKQIELFKKKKQTFYC